MCLTMCVKTGSVTAVVDSAAAGEPVCGRDERDAEETSGDASTSARRVTASSIACFVL